MLFWIAAVAAILQAIIGFSYFVSSIWEKERRASIFGGLQFLLMLIPVIMLFYIYSTGFFHTTPGIILLILGLMIGVGAVLALVLPLGVNPKALEGSRGLIVGEVSRQDEREIMFARLTNDDDHLIKCLKNAYAQHNAAVKHNAGLE